MRRAKVSTPPPGDTGTTMRIGRLGKTACARTMPGASTTPAVARSDEIASRRFVGMALTGCRSLLYYRERHQIERSEEHTSELQSLRHLVCRLLLEKKKQNKY